MVDGWGLGIRNQELGGWLVVKNSARGIRYWIVKELKKAAGGGYGKIGTGAVYWANCVATGLQASWSLLPMAVTLNQYCLPGCSSV